MKEKTNSMILCSLLLGLLAAVLLLTFLSLSYDYHRDGTMNSQRNLLIITLICLMLMGGLLFALRDYLKEISVKAYTDVTGVHDKKSLEKYLFQLRERSDTLDIGIMMFDLNGLKWINDNYGHERGDTYIQSFASCLTRILSENSFLARFGGDEFVIVQEHTSPLELHSMNQRLQQLVDEYNRTIELPLSYAVGYEVSYKNHYYIIDDLMRIADQNMYQDKLEKKSRSSENIRNLPVSRTVSSINEEILAMKLRSILQKNNHHNYMLFMTDMENFHFINDSYGYQMGNSVLNALYDSLRTAVESPFLYRLHSDVFVSIADMTGKDTDSIMAAMQGRNHRIGHHLAELFPIGSCVINTGACWLKDPTVSPEKYISHVNIARREAKKLPVHICCYSPKMAEAERSRAEVLHSFHQALKNEKFSIYFQPKISPDGAIRGAEVLVRWMQPDGTCRMPDTFIPLLEKTGDIVALDYYVYEKAFDWLHSRYQQGEPPLSLSLNVSAVHFAHPQELISRIYQLIEKYQIHTRDIIFEITESIYIHNLDTVNRVIEELHNHHIRISMDDFGSGYSSLSTLKDIHFDEVKLDRTFVSDGLTDSGKIVLQELFHILKRLNKSIVCEGVETKPVSDFLIGEGCDELQGFLYYRPMCEQDFTKLLLTHKKVTS